jgi:hypothetical protein
VTGERTARDSQMLLCQDDILLTGGEVPILRGYAFVPPPRWDLLESELRLNGYEAMLLRRSGS